MNALVVPTNSRERLADFLSAWAPWPWDLIIVVQDEPELDLTIPDGLEYDAAQRLQGFSWTEIDGMLADPTVISRRDSAVRSFGFWQAWRAGAEIIFTLDDDCYPSGDDLVGRHRDNLYRTHDVDLLGARAARPRPPVPPARRAPRRPDQHGPVARHAGPGRDHDPRRSR